MAEEKSDEEVEAKELPKPLRDALAKMLGMYLALLEPRYRIVIFVGSLTPLLRAAGYPLETKEPMAYVTGYKNRNTGKPHRVEYHKPEDMYRDWVNAQRSKDGYTEPAPGAVVSVGSMERLLLILANLAIETLVRDHPDVIERAVSLAEKYVGKLPRTSLEAELGEVEGESGEVVEGGEEE